MKKGHFFENVPKVYPATGRSLKFLKRDHFNNDVNPFVVVPCKSHYLQYYVIRIPAMHGIAFSLFFNTMIMKNYWSVGNHISNLKSNEMVKGSNVTR